MAEQVIERWGVWCEHADGRRYVMGDASRTRWSQATAEQVAKHMTAYEAGTFVARPIPAPLPRPHMTLDEMRVEAGQACIDWVLDTRQCHLCDYSDHDMDGGERHDDECPLRSMDDMDEGVMRSAEPPPTETVQGA